MIIKTIKVNQPDYPELLKQIYDPPKELYVAGDLKAIKNYPLAVVGTRKMSKYGEKITYSLIRSLSQYGLTIISGLALGIDGVAHRAALETNTKTIAVLGSGLNSIYPAVHKSLAEKIIAKHGAVISEYPPDTEPSKWTFPARNRIIAGLCLGVLVIEAPKKSGALITARFALDQGREVFAVPGNIDNPNSEGCNYLIKMGAKPITCPEDILESFNIEATQNNKKEILADSPEEELLLKILNQEPTHIDDLIKTSKIETTKIIACLTLMEINGKVKNLKNGYYVLNN